MTDFTQKSLEQYRATVRRSLGWLEKNDAAAEQMVDLSSHYKAPYLYAVVGEPVRARKYADLIRTRYLQPDGDFRTRPGAKGWEHLPCSPANRYIYSNGWLVTGFQRMGAYGLARIGLDFIRRFQSKELGGFYSRFHPERGAINRSYLDSSSTSSAGLALVACGQIEDAVRAGDFVIRLIESQPEPERYYYASWKVDTGIMTDVFGEEAPNALRGRKQFCLSTEADAAGELVWLIGKPMKFLAKLYSVTGDVRYRDGADELFHFFHRLSDSRWENPASCKIMWGSAELFRHTGEQRFSETATRILDSIRDSQRDWGGWVHTLWYEQEEDQPFPATLDIVQEFCGEITDAIFDLS